MNGYIMLPRSLFRHPIMKEPIALQCFLCLVYQARFLPGEVFFRGELIRLEAGQCVISRRELARTLHSSPDKTRRALERLQSHRLIQIETSQQLSIVTICDFEQFQPAIADPAQTQRRPAESSENKGNFADSDPAQTQQRPTYKKKEKKNDNNINNIYARAFEEFWDRYPNKFNRPQTERNFIKTAKAHGTDAVLRALDNYLAEIKRTSCDPKYIVRSTNFVGQKAYFLGYLEAPKPHGNTSGVVRDSIPDVEATKRLLAELQAEGGV